MVEVCIIEPFYTGSHAQWIEGYIHHSGHHIQVLDLPGNWWKWRMQGGAVPLAQQFSEMGSEPHLIVASDMLNLPLFLSLTRQNVARIPVAVYFHENQITYPWSPTDGDVGQNRDVHYGYINYASALAADACFFNSSFHMESFLEALTPFLKQFPDHNGLETVDIIRNKSEVLPLGLDLGPFDAYRPAADGQLSTVRGSDPPVILWNHRWEYDKNPEDFFTALYRLRERGCDFRLVVLGESFASTPGIFDQAREDFRDQVVHWGYASSREDYMRLLWESDIIPVTSNQEFFGVSLMEALYCQTIPLLPKRLTYPELVPHEKYSEYFYHTIDELVDKLEYHCSRVKTVKREVFQDIAMCYDWKNTAPVYDERFEKLACRG